VRWDLLAESKKQAAWKRLCQIPSIGPIRAAVLLGILQTPHRFRTKRQLWTYSGLAIEMHSSADHRRVGGQLQRAKKQVLVRGLNPNCNHDLKNLFKGAAVVASSKPGPFEEFCAALVAKGMRPEMALLTLARKIATIVLIVWKRGVCFDAQHLKPQTACFTGSRTDKLRCQQAMKTAGRPEALLDHKTGLFFEPGNRQALAQCIEELLDLSRPTAFSFCGSYRNAPACHPRG
jgi:hypothetical protein